MAYTINKTNGSVITTLSDGNIDQHSTSLTLIGRKYAGYGELQNENFVKLLENFSNTTAPVAPIAGQLWWDTTTGVLNAYTGSAWKHIPNSSMGSSLPALYTFGDLWWDTTSNQLKVCDQGGVFRPAGGSLTLSGDITGTGSQAITTALSATGVTAGNYGTASSTPVMSVDAKGRITSASNTAINITSSQVSNFAATTRTSVSANSGLTYNSTTGVFGVDTSVIPSAASGGSALVGYLPSGTGAVATTAQTKLRESVSIKDFGAVGDGVANDTIAWKAFVNYLAARGGEGVLNVGTYLVDSWSPDLSNNKPFRIRGESKNSSVIKNRTPDSSFFYCSNGNKITFDNFTMDGDYSGTPSAAVSGGNLAFVNSSYITIRDMNFVKFRRVAVMVYNDHQTTVANTYGWIVIDGCAAYGNSDYAAYVGPSAFLLADVNDSIINNCYIENIGLYGYEFKNDCSRTIISNCTAKHTYYPYYYGGDGAHTELGFVKDSELSNCIAISVYQAFACGYASNNKISNLLVDNTVSDAAWTPYFTIDIRNNSNNNSITNVTAINPDYVLCTIRDSANNNLVHFSNIFHNASTAHRGCNGITADCSGNTIIFGNRDTSHVLIPSLDFNNNTATDQKLYQSTLSAGSSQLIKTTLGGTLGADSISTVSKGAAWVGDTMDKFWITKQDNQYEYVGNFIKPNIVIERNKLDTGARILYVYDVAGATTEAWTWTKGSYFAATDNGVSLGTASRRWSTVYAGAGSINTSDAREKQQVRSLSDKEKAVASKIKGMIKAFKFNDSVEQKGADARIHFGVMAQEVKSAFESEGLAAEEYALLCYDEWPEQKEEKDNDGNIVQQYQAAGNRYGIRYDELLVFMLSAM